MPRWQREIVIAEIPKASAAALQLSGDLRICRTKSAVSREEG
jgi:hypothetical protein